MKSESMTPESRPSSTRLAPAAESLKSGTLRIDARVEEAEQVGDWVRNFLVSTPSSAADKDQLGRIELAVHELLINSIVHGTTTDDVIDIRATLKDNTFTIELRDRGTEAFEESSIEPRFDGEIAVGGYGLRIVRKVSSDLRYRRHRDENIWTVTFELAPQFGTAGR